MQRHCVCCTVANARKTYHYPPLFSDYEICFEANPGVNIASYFVINARRTSLTWSTAGSTLAFCKIYFYIPALGMLVDKYSTSSGEGTFGPINKY